MHILDLPENIFRDIFDYLEDKVVYYKVRAVCRQLRLHSDNYIQIVGKFLLLQGELLVPKSPAKPLQGSVSTWSLHIFTKRQTIRSFYWKWLNFSKISHTVNKIYCNNSKNKWASKTFGIVSNGIFVPGSWFSPQYYYNYPEIKHRLYFFDYNSRTNEFIYSTSDSKEVCLCEGIETVASGYNHSFSPHYIGRIIANFTIGFLTYGRTLRHLSRNMPI